MDILFSPGLVMLFFCLPFLVLQTREMATLLFVFLMFFCVIYGLNPRGAMGLFYDCGSSWSFICFCINLQPVLQRPVK